MRYIKYSFYVVCLLMLFAGYALLYSTSGLRVLVNIVDILSEAKISAVVDHGSLYQGVEIREIVYQDSNQTVSIDALNLQWQAAGLLFGKLYFSYITLIDVRVITGSNTTSEAQVQRDIWLPPLTIETFTVDKFLVSSPDKTELLQVDAFQFSLAYAGNKYILQDVLIKNDMLAIYADGSLEFIDPFNTLLVSQIVVTLNDKSRFTADLRLSGNRKNLLAELKFHENLQGNATINIENLLDNPVWKANIKLDKVNPRLIDPALPEVVADIELEMQGDTSGLEGDGQTQLLYKFPVDDKQAQSGVTRQERRVDSHMQFGINLDSEDIVVVLQKWRLASEEGEVEVSGVYNYSKNELQMDTRWDHLSWPLPGSNDQLATSGTFSIAGKLDDYSYETDIQVSGVTTIPPFRIVAPGTGNLAGLSAPAAEIMVMGGKLTAELEASWQDQPQFRINWRGDKLNPGLQWSEWQGDLSTSGAIKIASTSAGWLWELEQSTARGKLRNTAVSIDISGKSSEPGNASINAKAKYAQASAEVMGQLGKKLDLNWKIDSQDLSLVHPQMQGRLQSHGKLTGTPDKPGINAEIHAMNIHSPWGKSEEIAVDLRFDLSSDALIKTDITLNKISYEDFNIDHLGLKIDGHNSRHQFEVTTAMPGIDLELAGEGSVKASTWSGRISSMLVEHATYRNWKTNKSFTVSYDRESLRVGDFCLQQVETSLCADGHYQKLSREWELVAGARQVPLDLLQSRLPETVVIKGTMEAAMQIRGTGTTPLSGAGRVEIPSGSIDLTVTDEVDHQLALDQTYLDFKLNDGNLNTEGLVPAPGHGFKPLSTRFQIKGISEAASFEIMLISGELQGGIRDLSFLSAIIPQLIEVKGSADLDLQVSGSLAEPVYDGSISLKEGGFSSSDLGIGVKNIDFAGSKISENRYEIAGELQSGDGHLMARADIGQLGKKGPEFKVSVDGDNFELVNLPELWALVNPQLNSKLSLKEQVIEGTIIIPAARINLDEIALPSTLSADEIVDNAEVDEESRQSKRQIRVKVILGDAIQLTGQGISGNLVGELDVSTNKQGELAGDGEIAIANGKYSAYGQKLSIQEGRLLYSKSALDNPVLSVIAVREVGDIKVGLKVLGYLTAPDILLFSSSSMPQEQILAYIIFGRPLNALSSGEGSDLLGAAASMGLRNSGFITEKVAARFGLDQVSISGTTTQSASLVVGKYINPKLYLSYGLGIFDKISKARLRYDMSSRISLEAERGAETGVDVFYKIEK